MSVNKGLFKEDELMLHLHSHHVKELSSNLRSLLERLFGPLLEEEAIACEKPEGSVKPDLTIHYKGQIRQLSIKSGRSDCVHQQIVKDFVLFLRGLGVSKRTQQTILLYHYGDGTMDGSAPERFSYERLRLLLAERIKQANDELNEKNQFIWAVVEKCVFDGFVENAPRADAIYHGDYKFGEAITRRQMQKYIMRKDWNFLNNLHIGPLLLRPCGRYIGKAVVNEKRRQRLECYWPHLKDDIDYIARRYDD